MLDLPFKLAEAVQDYGSQTRRRVLSILRMLEPHHAAGLRKVRLGRTFDGGYVMADDFTGATAAYSLGVSQDVSWDMDIASRGIDVFQYDPTIQRLPELHARFAWKSIGVGAHAITDGSVDTLAGIVRMNGHERDRDLLLNCDIEGHEWSVFAGMYVAVIAQFRQIVLEVHALQQLCQPEFAEVARRAICNLTAHHRVIHVHANNYGPWAVLGGIPVPTVLELTLLRSDRGVLEPSHERFPSELDMPNDPKTGDFPLGDFRF